MVVVAMVGVLTGLAVVYVKPSSYAENARGYAQQISALCDAVRQRAVASRTRQKLEIDADQVIHWQATTTGMAPATAWRQVGTTPVPGNVTITAFDDRPHVDTDDGVPVSGTGLPAEIEFTPDGAAQGATIFVTDDSDQNRARVVVYGATGSAYAYNEW